MTWIVVLIMLSGCAFPKPADASEYAVAVTPAPVLNTPDFKIRFYDPEKASLRDGRHLPG